MLIPIFLHSRGGLAEVGLLAGWDPLIFAVFALIGWVYRRGVLEGGEPRTRRCFYVGLLVTAVAVASPLEVLAEQLATAHMVQHILLLLVAAPLFALGRPVETMLRALPRSGRKTLGRARRKVGATPRRARKLHSPIVVWLAYAGAIWFWHGSAPYELAISVEGIHLVEHAVFVLAGLSFWAVVLRPGVSPGYRLMMVFTTAFHSVILAALITFAVDPWYPAYAETSTAWGLTPLEDQQLAGLLMWIPGGLLYTGVGIHLLLELVGRDRPRSGSEAPAAQVGLPRTRG